MKLPCACGREIPPDKYEIAIVGGLNCKKDGMSYTPDEVKSWSDEQDDLSSWFEKYDRENPKVYQAFKALAQEKRAEGHPRYGAKTIMEILRWESSVRYKGDDFKLGNNIKDRCSARYARKLIREDPSFKGFFETRELSTPDVRERLSDAHSR